MQGKRRLALWPSACEKPTRDLILWFLWNVLRKNIVTLRSPVIDPISTSFLPRPLDLVCPVKEHVKLIPVHQRTFYLFSLTVYSQKMFEWANQNAFGNASICVWFGFQKAFPFMSPQSDWLSVVFYTLLRKGKSLWPWLDLGHLVSFNLLSIPPAQYLSSPKKTESNFFL